ncbi:hypothetical protein EDB80DRAFT_783175 [Ilyonectria destructans]|nr:hypothetical protein EDB80DRAFT_783175 [Ilyonectria destructans]
MGLVLSSHQRLRHRGHVFTNQVPPGTVSKAEEDDSSQLNPCLGSKGGTQPRELYGVGLIRAYTRRILKRSPSQDVPLSPSSPQDLSGTFNITENYIELASDPIADRNILWIILETEAGSMAEFTEMRSESQLHQPQLDPASASSRQPTSISVRVSKRIRTPTRKASEAQSNAETIQALRRSRSRVVSRKRQPQPKTARISLCAPRNRY